MTINYDCPLNKGHFDRTYFEQKQSRQWVSVSFPNPLLFCLLLCARTLPNIPFISKVRKMYKIDGHDVEKAEWIKLQFLMDLDNPA
jgi:hypothetical protein